MTKESVNLKKNYEGYTGGHMGRKQKGLDVIIISEGNRNNLKSKVNGFYVHILINL